MRKFQLIIACVCGLLGTANTLQAQSWKDILSNENVSKAVDAVKEVTGIGAITDITGTWTYTGAAVEFESEDLLKKAGGAVAATNVENRLNEQLEKVGIKAGTTTYTFNEDGTFNSVTGKRTTKGRYTFDSSTSILTLKYVGLVSMNATVSGTTNKMSLLYDADKLLMLITFLGSKVNNTTIKAITSIAQSYDGMKMGMEMKKQD